MRRLGSKVNIIPVIAKSDTLSPNEMAAFKKRVIEDIGHYQISIYNFPFNEEEDEAETIEENNELRSLLPFAVVGSEEEVIMNGRRVRCRQYPWGTVEGKKSVGIGRKVFVPTLIHLFFLKSIILVTATFQN